MYSNNYFRSRRGSTTLAVTAGEAAITATLVTTTAAVVANSTTKDDWSLSGTNFLSVQALSPQPDEIYRRYQAKAKENDPGEITLYLPKDTKAPPKKGPTTNNGIAPQHRGQKHNRAIDDRVKQLRKDKYVKNLRKTRFKLIKTAIRLAIIGRIFNMIELIQRLKKNAPQC